MNDKRLRVEWVQALRGMAAVAVVLTHARFQLQDTPISAEADRWLKPGEAGVDLFFVISGFIMAYTTRRDAGGPVSARAFMVKRIARIWPAYAVTSFLTLCLGSGIAAFAQPAAMRRLLKSLVFMPADYSGLYAPQTLPQGWTLNYEAYFYLVLALCLACGRWRWLLFAGWFGTTLVVLPLLYGASSLLSPFTPFVDGVYPVRYMGVVTNPIIWEFVGGVAAGFLFASPLRLHSRLLSGLAVVAATVVMVRFLFDDTYTHGPAQWGWIFVLFVLTLAIAGKDIEIRPPAFMVRLGNMSYTLYLVHLMVLSELPVLFDRLGLGPEVHSISYLVNAVLASVLCAAVSYRFLEQTLPRHLRGALRSMARHRRGLRVPAPDMRPAEPQA